VHRYSYLPNLLSSLRIALAPAILAAAVSDSRPGFWVLLGTALVSDAVDGRIARLWQAETPLGARLDQWGDALTMIATAIGIDFLWPGVIETEWTWALVALAGYLLIGVKRLLSASDAVKRPTWYSTAISWFIPLSLIPLLVAGNPWPFRYAAVVHWIIAGAKVLAPFSPPKPRRSVRGTQPTRLAVREEQPAGRG
jgi:CDP-diacylglycerol--glycerol-3-phosphate 3-phosphatidyltransferase